MSSGVAWIDRKVGELKGAREYLELIGLAPARIGSTDSRDIGHGGWRVPYWIGVFTDDQLIDFAKARGFRP